MEGVIKVQHIYDTGLESLRLGTLPPKNLSTPLLSLNPNPNSQASGDVCKFKHEIIWHREGLGHSSFKLQF